MRIISGSYRGRRLNPPLGRWPTRPTTDMARESLFNILRNTLDFEKIKVLELFGGTGAHTYECVSLGCKAVTYVEKYGPCVDFVSRTLQELDVVEYVDVQRKDAFEFLRRNESLFDYVFADPPYDLQTLTLIPEKVLQDSVIEKGGVFVLEHDSRHSFSTHEYFWKEKKYGISVFSFFQYEEVDR